MIDILKAMDDPALFGPWFNKDSRTRKNWRAWRSFLAALFGLQMNRVEQRIYRQCTQRESLPESPSTEGFLVVGRRGGKSQISALIAVFIAAFIDWTPYLAPGERGTCMLISADRRQARTLKRYISALLNNVALLSPSIAKETAELIELTNRINIEIHTCSFRSVRGYTIVACLCDEIAFWRSEDSASPDVEVLNAIRPGMATVPGSILLALSSPYGKKGVLYTTYKRHFGKAGPVMVWQADTRTMNPTVPESFIEQAYASCPVSAAAEHGANFRADLSQFVEREIVEATISPGQYELPPLFGIKYRAFIDPAGGSGQDSMTLAIAHNEGGLAVLDAVREVQPPFSPQNSLTDFAQLLKRYRIRQVTGDRFGGEFPREILKKRGISYEIADKSKSDLYREFLPLLNSQQVQLLDNKRLVYQLSNLERRTSTNGKDVIQHPAGQHDDLANVVAGVLVGSSKTKHVGTWGSPQNNRKLFGPIAFISRRNQL